MAHAKWSEKDKKPEELRGFMYGVEYGYHLGHDLFGVPVYPSLSDLYDSARERQKNVAEDDKYPGMKNYPQDGIVEVEIKFIRHIPAEQCWEEKEKENGTDKKENTAHAI